MESTIISLLGGELGVTTLLLLFIIGLLTKRFVPWWVYDAIVEELNVYQKEAPALLTEVHRLLKLVEQQDDERSQNRPRYEQDDQKPRASKPRPSSRSRRRDRQYE